MRKPREYRLVLTSWFALVTVLSMAPPASAQVKAPEEILPATSPQACRPLRPPAIKSGIWTDDTNYDLVESAVDGGKRIRVVGDILRVSEKDFGSIIRDVDKAPRNIREIVFDAREIHIEAPLSFASARVVILADQVIFGSRGSIYLTSNPNQANDGLQIFARSIAFENAMPRPFQFTTSSGSNRKIIIASNFIKIEKEELKQKEAAITM